MAFFKDQPLRPRPPRFRSQWNGGDFVVYDLNGAEVFKLNGAANTLEGAFNPKAGSIPNSALANVPTFDGGAPTTITILTTGVCSDGETITLGGDIWVLRFLTTDTTDDTADGDFNVLTDPLVLLGGVAKYANVNFAVGELLEVDGEVMAVLSVSHGNVFLKRGASGTTPAAHANGVNIFQHANPIVPAASQIYCGLLTNDADDMRAALAWDINNRGTQFFIADEAAVALAAEVYVQTADSVGGAYVSSDTLPTFSDSGANIGTEATVGRLPGAVTFGSRLYEAKAHEVANGFVQISFGFTVEGFVAQVFDATWVLRGDITDLTYPIENRVVFEAAGAVNVAATDVILVLAWGG